MTTQEKRTIGEGATQLRVVSLRDFGLDESQKKQGNLTAFSVWIRALLQNWRQGTVGCKGRADVNRTNKKPFKQKGTGRARAGSARSPLWKGGGVIFGPQPRVHTIKFTGIMKKQVLNALFFDFVEGARVAALDWLPDEMTSPKTAVAYSALKAAQMHTKKVALFLPHGDLFAYAAFANIPNVRILFFDQANAYDLADSQQLLFLNRDFDQFKEMVVRWI